MAVYAVERSLDQKGTTGSFGSSGGLRLAGWTCAKRSASVGRKSSDARSIRSPVSSRLWSPTLKSAPSSPSIAGAAIRCKRDWSSMGAWCRGATAERLLGGSWNRRHGPHHQSVSAQKLVDFPSGVRRSLRGSRPLSPSVRGPLTRALFPRISDRCLISEHRKRGYVRT